MDTQKKTDKKDWHKISSFCNAFLQACKARKLPKEEVQAEIIKSAQADPEVAQEWIKFLSMV